MTSVSELSPGTWTVDPTHSEVGFVARHLMVSKVRGSFTQFEATVLVGDSFDTSSVQATVQLASIDTGSADRDTHLKSADFFDTDSHPVMTFTSTSVSSDKLVGDLTIKGVTRQVAFDLDFAGVSRRPVGRHPRRLRGDHRDQPQGLRPRAGTSPSRAAACSWARRSRSCWTSSSSRPDPLEPYARWPRPPGGAATVRLPVRRALRYDASYRQAAVSAAARRPRARSR